MNVRKGSSIVSGFLKSNKKSVLLTYIATFVTATFLCSCIMQNICVLTGAMKKVPLSYFNIVFVFYYGFIKLWLPTLFLTLVVATFITYYRLYRCVLDSMYDKERNFEISLKGTYGTSESMKEVEKDTFLHRVEDLTKNKDLIIGENKDGTIATLTPYQFPSPHKLVVGCTGSGKTSGEFMNDIICAIERGESIVVTDPKSELRNLAKKYAELHDYKTYEFNLINLMLSDGLNFFDYITKEDDAKYLTDVIMANSSNGTGRNEDFWDKAERALITFAIMYVYEDDSKTYSKSLAGVVEFLSQEFSKIEEVGKDLTSKHKSKKQWDLFTDAPQTAKGGIKTGVGTRLQILNSDNMKRILSRSDIDFRKIGEEKGIYFIIIPDTNKTYQMVTSMFFSVMFKVMIEQADKRYNQSLKVPVNIIFEEYRNLGDRPVPDLHVLLATVRSRKIAVTLCFQDIGGMKDTFQGNMFANIMSNCDTRVLLGINEVNVSGTFWQGECGTLTAVTESQSGDKPHFLSLLFGRGINDNKREVMRYVYTADEIYKMLGENKLVFFRGHNVLKIRKFQYFKHPFYKEIDENKESCLYHVPSWWKEVQAEYKRADSDSKCNYDWFVQGLSEVKKMQAELEESKTNPEQERVAEAAAVDRVRHGSKEEVDEDVKAVAIKAKLRTTFEQVKNFFATEVVINEISTSQVFKKDYEGEAVSQDATDLFRVDDSKTEYSAKDRQEMATFKPEGNKSTNAKSTNPTVLKKPKGTDQGLSEEEMAELQADLLASQDRNNSTTAENEADFLEQAKKEKEEEEERARRRREKTNSKLV